MSQIAMEIADMVEKLPREEQKFVYQIVKKIVLAWNLNFDMEAEHRLEAYAEQQEKEKRMEALRSFLRLAEESRHEDHLLTDDAFQRCRISRQLICFGNEDNEQ